MKRGFSFLLALALILSAGIAHGLGFDDSYLGHVWPLDDGGFTYTRSQNDDHALYLGVFGADQRVLWEKRMDEPEKSLYFSRVSQGKDGGLIFWANDTQAEQWLLKVYSPGGDLVLDRRLDPGLNLRAVCAEGLLAGISVGETALLYSLYTLEGDKLCDLEGGVIFTDMLAFEGDFILFGLFGWEFDTRRSFIMRVRPSGQTLWRYELADIGVLPDTLKTDGQKYVVAMNSLIGSQVKSYTDSLVVLDAATGEAQLETRFYTPYAHSDLMGIRRTDAGLEITVIFREKRFQAAAILTLDSVNSIADTRYYSLLPKEEVSGLLFNDGGMFFYGGIAAEKTLKYSQSLFKSLQALTPEKTLNYTRLPE